jgi:hypothetical protein
MCWLTRYPAKNVPIASERTVMNLAGVVILLSVEEGEVKEGRDCSLPSFHTGYGVLIGNGSAFVHADESPMLLFARMR